MGIGIKELIVILVIVLLLFGTKRLKTLGTDLGSAIKGFKKSMGEEDNALQHKDGDTIDGQAEPVQRSAQNSRPDDQSKP